MSICRPALTALVLSVATLLPACGGGGGGGEEAAPAAPAPTSWYAADPGPGFDYALAMAAGPEESTYVTGWFPGAHSWDAGESSEVTRSALAFNDGYVQRRDAEGNLLWFQQILSTDYVEPTEVVTLPDGSCVVAGETEGLTIFAPLEAEQTTLDTGPILFVARYAPDGRLQWLRTVNGSLEARDSAVFPDGSFLLSGLLYGTVVFGPGEAGETTLVCTAGFSDYVARFDSNGNLMYAVSPSSCNRNTIAGGVAALPNGSAVVAGSFSETPTFGNETFTATGTDDGYVCGLSSTGTLLWARHLAGDGRELPYGADALPNGTVAIVGSSTTEAMTLSEGENDGIDLSTTAPSFTFVCRYSSSGALLWATRIDQAANAFINLAGIVAYPDDSIGVVGAGPGTVTVDPDGPDRQVLPAFQSSDLFLARYDATGRVIAARRDGGPGAVSRIGGITAYADGSLGCAGGYQGEFTLDHDGPNETPFPEDPGTGDDSFAIRYNADLSHDG